MEIKHFTPEVKVNTATQRPVTAQRTQMEALPRPVADKHFFLNYTSAHIVLSALDLGWRPENDYPTKNQPPQDASQEERKAWVYQAIGDLLNQYCFCHWSGHDKYQ